MNARSTSWQRNSVAALFCVVGLVGHAGNARAADQVVSDFGDSGGPNQLRAKINAVQSTGGGTITFAGSGTVVLGGAQLPTITGEITIDGGASGVTISGGNASRIMFVAAGSKLTLRNLTFTKGYSANADGGALWTEAAVVIENCKFIDNQAVAPYSGGAIVAYQPLTIRNSEFALNKAAGGAAIYPRFGTAVTTIIGSDFHDNEALGTSAGFGGALLLWDGAPVTVERTVFRNNNAERGGAVYVTPNSRLEVMDSSFTGNLADRFGGGVYNRGNITLGRVTMSANRTNLGNGGGIYNEGAATLFDLRVSGNSAGIGGAIQNIGTLGVLRATLDGNRAIHGAGLHHTGGSATLTNVTLSANGAFENGGGITTSAGLTLTNVTLNGNTAGGEGGGIFRAGAAQLTIRNTLISRGTPGANCSAALGGSFNLSDDNTCGFGAGRDNVSLPLEPLAENGGYTPTHMLPQGSVAIDGGTVTGAPTRDQREYVRAGTAPDVGAVEFRGTIPVTLANISTRLRVLTGNDVLIGGFIITGSQPKRLIARAIGPSLGLAGALADPQLEIFDGAGNLIAASDNWQDAPNRQEIIDSSIAPSNDAEAAVLRALAPGAYTAVVSGVNGGTGVGLVEVYDLDRTSGSKLANIATRGFVQTGDDVMIGGTIVIGSQSQKVLLRGIGPSLQVNGRLADPLLELYDGNGVLLAANNNWRDTQQAQIEATSIPPANDLESAIVAELAPAAYTAVLRGVNGAVGVALVEAYALD